ncbi:GNAT family N-acetyltransferase [Rossellomorea vietnamensis]|uniref:GNAT family N-acetyltransferase n=1 Tax=Rossellomorea vietnamensis TaxID=218284 RepID=A0A5D4NUZ9_9BACI|nr:GNAT family N-acetyltransferase [Rossellomorea vietnamensis]TYS16562.1 GNAT family N-acetyltransferase [Rossellomorea vietnamensis]
MILEMKESEFYRCKNLMNAEGHLEVMSVINGGNPGRVFVDDLHAPSSGVIWLGSNNGFIFFGDEKNQEFNQGLNDLFSEVVKPEYLKQDFTCFEAIGNHPGWDQTFEEVFGRNLTSYKQRVYELHRDQYKKEAEPGIEPEYKVMKITKEILVSEDTSSYKNIDFLQGKILDFWISPEKFLDDGVGYSVVHGNEIVSVCFSGVAAGSVHGIDIETLKAHQGKKLAQKAAHFYVRECLENSITPYWDCMEINSPSVSVAENLGFTNTFNYKWYSTSFD